jgi:S-adenosylmethionine-diacylglycerol 3-amino-3-carboxypropyl transferase
MTWHDVLPARREPGSPLPARVRRQLSDHVFRSLLEDRLVYNQCWEDPRLDRAAMRLGPDSQVAMIASAGCNALDYVLDEPAGVHAIDVNPKQTALLELKLAAARVLEWVDFFALFGKGVHPDWRTLYQDRLRPSLGTAARDVWDQDMVLFAPGRFRRSFYYCGTSGVFAFAVTRILGFRPWLREAIEHLLDAPDLEAQRERYAVVERWLFSPVIRWICRQDLSLTLMGIPKAQQIAMLKDHPEGVGRFVEDSMRRVFTEVPVRDNYFWRVYVTGRYTPECCPRYLQRSEFERLRDLAPRVTVETATLTDALRRWEGPRFTHFVLLDHQDWLAHHAPDALSAEWDAILGTARADARVLFRSGAKTPSFLPRNATDAIRLHPEVTAPLHGLDRVGTYASFHLASLVGE